MAAAFLKGELGINTSDWNSVSREYDLRKEAEYIHDEMLKRDMVDVDDSYQKGDIIIYKAGKYRAAVATCVDEHATRIEGCTVGNPMKKYAKLLPGGGIEYALDQTINCISNTVNSVTKVVVPNSSVCPGWGPTCTHAIPCPTTAAPAA